MTEERLAALLEAYGAAPDRWPDDERPGAEALLARSAEARRRCDEARRLDALLDALPAAPPSADLVRGVLASAPRRRVASRLARLAAVAAPLAAAAAFALWLVAPRAPQPSVELTRVEDAAQALWATEAAAPTPGAGVAAVALGEFSAPTDALLGAYAIDVSSALPEVGCSGSTLGCPRIDSAADPLSARPNDGRSLA